MKDAFQDSIQSESQFCGSWVLLLKLMTIKHYTKIPIEYIINNLVFFWGSNMELEGWLLIGFGITFVYWYLTRNHDYWSSRGVPGPRPIPFFATYLCQFFIPFQDSEMERYKKYGKIYGIYDGTTPGLIVGRPDLIKDIMIGKTALDVFPNRRAVKTNHPVMSNFLSSLEDDQWKRVRSITAPTFSSGKLKSIIPIMGEASTQMLNFLEEKASLKSDVDLKELFGTYTMDVIAKSAFATTPNPYFVTQASLLFTFPFWRKFLDYVIPAEILQAFGFTVLPKEPMDFFKEITLKVIRSRREQGIQHPDFLQLLMNAEVEDGGIIQNRQLSEDEILGQAVLFFSVGFETSSQLLTYTCYCLALHPGCQEKAFEEVQAAFGDGVEGEINAEIIQRLPYLNAVIDESLRLYNPVLRMERRANNDYILGDTGITIPKGMIVGIPVWALHHSEEYFPDPFHFNPDRFLPENKGKIIPSTYLPFGDGPRNCIGSRFALLECRLALAKILRKFRFVPSKGTKTPLEFFPTGRPLLGPKSVFVGVEKRE